MNRISSLFRSVSFWSVIVVILTALTIRFSYFTNESGREAKNGYNATTWDALGYYMYLPGYLIYGDVKELKWFPEIDRKYQVSGGQMYQATKLDKGGYAFKYLGGVAVMELPFFCLGHAVAYFTDAPADGFSWPYQYAIILGAVFWFSLGCFILRKVLLRFYSEAISSVTILLICLASNILQYVSADGAMSHAFIFPLYALVLWFTIRWHEKPEIRYAAGIGLVSGLAVISRPTELIIVFIPLLWSLNVNGSLKTKWQLVKQHKSHIIWVLAAGFAGILPQLLYWKHATGSFIYDVGSKWNFLDPWWRVLFGFGKGWFIYTPIAIFMVLGLFFLKGKPYKKAVITFCLLNIWIIISWSDWRYGASYSTRALTQSYPVFALALAAFLERSFSGRKKWIVAIAGVWLIFVNLFQIGQYNATVLHYDQMNARYYRAIFLDWNPSPLDYSLLDTDEFPDESSYSISGIKTFRQNSVTAKAGAEFPVGSVSLKEDKWAKVKLKIVSVKGRLTATLSLKCFLKDQLTKEKHFRFAVPKGADNKLMTYECYLRLPEDGSDRVAVAVDTYDSYAGKNAELTITLFK